MKSLPIHNPDFVEMHHEYEKSILARGDSCGSDGLPRRVREFLFFLNAKKIEKIEDVHTQDIIAFYEYLRERPNQLTEGGLSDTYIRMQLGAVRSFFDFLLKSKRITAIPCALPRFSYSQGKERMPLTEQQIGLLYAAAKDKMDSAILAAAYGAGLRASECADLDVNDIVFSQNVLVVRESKNNKSRTVPLAKGVVKDLREYLVYERPNRVMYNRPCSAFFLNKSGQRMNYGRFNIRFQKMVQLTGNKELIAKNPCLHQLRHSIATHLINNGATAEFVRKMLGHSLLNTTVGIYAKRRRQKKRLLDMFKGDLAQRGIENQ